MNAIVLDLETIPDLELWQPAEPEVPADPEKCEKCLEPCSPEEHQIRKCPKMQKGKCRRPEVKPVKAQKDEFPPIHAHKVVVLGAMLIEQNVPVSLWAWPTLDQEGGLLKAFAELMTARTGYDLVTWNGTDFDLKVIEMRSIIHGVPQGWYDGTYRNRYEGGANVDLARVWGTARGQGAYIKLDTAAKMIGLPGKNGMDGSMIRALVEAGQLTTASNYCQRDVVQTAYLYFRYKLVRGWITMEVYKAACEKIAAMYAENPSFDDFVIETQRLLP